MVTHYGWVASTIAFFGRVLFSIIFVIAAISNLLHFQATAAYMASIGVPYSEVALGIASAMQLIGGILVILGWLTRVGAFLLFIFLVAVTYLFHTFWSYGVTEILQTPSKMPLHQFEHFIQLPFTHSILRNITFIGGTLYIMAFGPGKISLDGLRYWHVQRRTTRRVTEIESEHPRVTEIERKHPRVTEIESESPTIIEKEQENEFITKKSTDEFVDKEK